MKMMIDSLESVKMMESKGVDKPLAEAIVSTITKVDVVNAYSKDEVNDMLAQTVQDILTESRNSVKDVISESRREFDKRFDAQREDMKSQREDMKIQFKEFRSTKHWVIGLVLTVGTTWIINLFHPLMNLTH